SMMRSFFMATKNRIFLGCRAWAGTKVAPIWGRFSEQPLFSGRFQKSSRRAMRNGFFVKGTGSTIAHRCKSAP
ncbi:MAG TPA: hypothetical protein VFD66_04300, partial [Verrucomicrobiae bacterium]|nr:hypothetical protein [Verrucomicrobiae bacterium]